MRTTDSSTTGAFRCAGHAGGRGFRRLATTHEIFPAISGSSGPYGLGCGCRAGDLAVEYRRLGNSQVFDNVSDPVLWSSASACTSRTLRRAARSGGDLTSAFDFETPIYCGDAAAEGTVAYRPPDNQKHPDYKPGTACGAVMPVQEPGYAASACSTV